MITPLAELKRAIMNGDRGEYTMMHNPAVSCALCDCSDNEKTAKVRGEQLVELSIYKRLRMKFAKCWTGI